MQYISNHSEQAIARLITQYKNNTDFIAVINAFVAQFQDLEDNIVDLYGRLQIGTVTGQQLDNLGKILGLGRQGFDDNIYRTLLMAKLLSNISLGTPNEIINIFSILTNSGVSKLFEIYPATIQLQGEGVLDPSIEPYIPQIMQKALPAGVQIGGLVLYEEDSFVIDDDLDPVSEGDGFGDDTDLTAGGQLGWDL